MRRICRSMLAACLIGGLMASAVTSTGHATEDAEWEQDLGVSSTMTEGSPAVDGATGSCSDGVRLIPC
jgi:hypothetical protein